MKPILSRRSFLETASLAGAGLSLALPKLAAAAGSGGLAFAAEVAADKPAKLGGKPLCAGFPGWPVFDQTEEKALLDTLHSRAFSSVWSNTGQPGNPAQNFCAARFGRFVRRNFGGEG